MPSRRKLDLEKIRASLNTVLPTLQCQHPAGTTKPR
jgi:hypothetical protein